MKFVVLGTELDRTTYQDSTRLPDYAPPSIQTKIGLHSQDLTVDGPNICGRALSCT